MASRNRKTVRGATAAPPPRSTRKAGAVVAVAVMAIAAGAAWWALRPAPARGPNLILITIDPLRADHVGAYGASAGATPTLDALARRGARFEQVQTAVPLTGTSL